MPETYSAHLMLFKLKTVQKEDLDYKEEAVHR
jgi:hypothetical protein